MPEHDPYAEADAAPCRWCGHRRDRHRDYQGRCSVYHDGQGRCNCPAWAAVLPTAEAREEAQAGQLQRPEASR